MEKENGGQTTTTKKKKKQLSSKNSPKVTKLSLPRLMDEAEK